MAEIVPESASGVVHSEAAIPAGNIPISERVLDIPFPIPPTEDELPCSDGVPMESLSHYLQSWLLIETLRYYWRGRRDVFVGGNQFVYYQWDDGTGETRSVGPDVYIVLDVSSRIRKSWVVWQEGKAPDVVIELLSDSNPERDKREKPRIYQDHLRVPEYFWFGPNSGELAGFALREGAYEPIEPGENGALSCRVLGLILVRWEGVFSNEEHVWLRWATPDGELLPTPEETAQLLHKRAEQETQRAEQETQRAEQEAQRVQKLADRLRELGIDPDGL